MGIEVEVPLLQLLEQDAAVSLDDRLRQAGGAGRVEDPERVVEGDPREGQLNALAEVEQLSPGHRLGEGRALLECLELGGLAQVGDDDDPLEARDLGGDLGDGPDPVEVPAAVAVAVDDEHHLRLDLGESVHDARRPEVRRAARPGRAEAGRCEECDQRLGAVGEVGDHPVSRGDPEGLQALANGRHPLAQLAPAELGELAELRGVDDRHLGVGLAAEDVLRVVEPGPREPLRAGHDPVPEDLFIWGVRDHLEVVPDRGPEVLELGHRPFPQRPVVVRPDTAFLGEPAHVSVQE